MDDYDAVRAVSNWGIRLTEASKSLARSCSSNQSTEGCDKTRRVSMGGVYRNMAKNVVGFAKDAPYSSATNATLAVVCQCPGCQDLYWYHINREAVEAFVVGCPLWPAEQKAKFETH
jgi:hypothetical protein